MRRAQDEKSRQEGGRGPREVRVGQLRTGLSERTVNPRSVIEYVGRFGNVTSAHQGNIHRFCFCSGRLAEAGVRLRASVVSGGGDGGGDAGGRRGGGLKRRWKGDFEVCSRDSNGDDARFGLCGGVVRLTKYGRVVVV